MKSITCLQYVPICLWAKADLNLAAASTQFHPKGLQRSTSYQAWIHIQTHESHLEKPPHIVFLLNQTQTTLKRKLSLDHWFSPSCCSLVTDLENPARNNSVGARKGEKKTKKTSGFCHSVCRRGHIRGVWTNIDMSGDFRGSLFSSVPLPRLAWVGLNRAWASHRECARRVPVAAAAQINHSPSILSFILLHTLTRIC